MGIFDIIYSIGMIALLTMAATCLYQEKASRISPMPTMPWTRAKIMSLLDSRFNSEGVYKIAELGCGWGGMNLSLARKYGNSTVKGYELSSFPFLFSKMRAFCGSRRISISNTSFFEADLSDFDMVICYLSPWHMNELKPQLLGLKKGSVIISNAFEISDWVIDETINTNVGMKIPVHVYVI